MCERGFGHHGFHGHSAPLGLGFGTCCCGPWMRRFPSREEQVKLLEDYKKGLEEELAEVNKHLEDLRK